MAYSILLAFEKPDLSSPENEGKWEKFLRILEGISKQNKGCLLLGENVLLLSLNENLQGISDAVHYSSDLSYSYTILTEPIEWHRTSKEKNKP